MTKNLTIKIGDYTFSAFQAKMGDADSIDLKPFKWYWHCKAKNGELVCTSGESFASKGNAERAMRGFIEAVRVEILPEGQSDY